MSSIRVEARGRVWEFDGSAPIRIGRHSDAEVTLESAVVSRAHAEIHREGNDWVLVDRGGPNGTWIADQRIVRKTLSPMTEVRFGDRENGVHALLTLLPIEPTSNMAIGGGIDEATVSWSNLSTPNFVPSLLVNSRAGETYFAGDRAVRIGRDPNLEVVVANPAISRFHAVIEPRPDGWWFVNHSRAGSFCDGEEVTVKRLTGPTELRLGHPTGGYRLELVPMVATAEAKQEIARQKKATKPSSRGIKIAMALMLVLIVGIGGAGAFALFGQKEPQGPSSAATLEAAKKASVEIIIYGANDRPLGHGSGSVISDDGLILTNAHVAAPDAPGMSTELDEPIKEFRVALREADDRPTQPVFKAETIVADGYLDLAVMKITSRVDGAPIKSGDIPAPIPLGDSNKVSTGDPITALGYPALTDDDQSTVESPLTVTRGTVSTLLSDPLTKIDRAWIESDVRIGSGNSGGASINADGELIGINTRVVTAESTEGTLGHFTSGSSRIRPVALAADVIRIAKAGGDRNYTSPALSRVPLLASAGWSTTGDSGCDGASSLRGVRPGDTIYAEFRVERIPNNMTLTWGFIAFVNGDKKVLSEKIAQWSDGPAATCIALPLDVPTGVTAVNAALLVGPNNEIVAENVVELR